MQWFPSALGNRIQDVRVSSTGSLPNRENNTAAMQAVATPLAKTQRVS
jgi:hypothetical protein